MVCLNRMQIIESGYFADVTPHPKPTLRTDLERELDKSVLPKQYYHGMYAAQI